MVPALVAALRALLFWTSKSEALSVLRYKLNMTLLWTKIRLFELRAKMGNRHPYVNTESAYDACVNALWLISIIKNITLLISVHIWSRASNSTHLIHGLLPTTKTAHEKNTYLSTNALVPVPTILAYPLCPMLNFSGIFHPIFNETLWKVWWLGGGGMAPWKFC